MNNLRCPNCSFLNFATASDCKRCGLPFNSPTNEASTGTEWNMQPPAFPAYPPPPTAAEAYLWNQPPFQPGFTPPPMMKKSGGSKARVIILGAVLAFLVLSAVPMLLKNKRSNFKNLSWSEYNSPDGKFSMSLPMSPKISERAIPTPFGNATAHIVDAQVSLDGGCMVLYTDYPVQEKVSEEDIKGAATSQKQMTIGAQKFITLNGHRGMEVELKPGESRGALAGTLRLFWISPRLYIILAGGPETPEFKAVQTRCMDSFQFKF
jgi:hypothetical protein